MVLEDMVILGRLLTGIAANMMVLERQIKYMLAPCTFFHECFMIDFEVCLWIEMLVQTLWTGELSGHTSPKCVLKDQYRYFQFKL